MGELDFECNGIKWDVDPLNKFNLDVKEVDYMLGFIPTFIRNSDDVVGDALRAYKFGGPEMGGVVTQEGIYLYPGDPELFPIAKCHAGNQLIYVYQFAIIAFLNKETHETIIYRFD